MVRSEIEVNEMPKSNITEVIRNVYSTVSAQLQCPFAKDSSVLDVGDFRLDLARRRAALKGIDLGLTSLEFELLLFLVSHPNRVVTSHTQLATRSTDDPAHRTEILPAVISLRRKLEAIDCRQRYLLTEPWIFCRFNTATSS